MENSEENIYVGMGLKELTQHPASYFNFTYHPTSRENHVELFTAVPENIAKKTLNS